MDFKVQKCVKSVVKSFPDSEYIILVAYFGYLINAS